MSDERILAITVPKWGMSMDEGTVTCWHLEEGAAVAAGDEVLDMESTKIANAIEAKGGGILRRQVADVGATLTVGALLGVIAPGDIDDDAIETFVSGYVVEAVDAEDGVSGPATQTIMAGERAIRYVVHGEGGEPVVLVHGFGGDMNAWMFNQDALASDRAVYSLDLPGHGGSVKDVGDGSLDVLVAAVDAVMTETGAYYVHLVGHSLGGAVALQVALDKPEKIASLTLIAPAGLGRDINGGYISGFVAAQRRKDMKPLAEQLFADPSMVTRQMVEELLRSKRIDGVDAALAGIAARQFDGDRQTIDLAARAGDLDVPVQVIWGADDRIIPTGHAGNLEGAAVHVIHGAGHMPMMEKAAEVNELIRSFIA
ncbi:MAG: acetoin dehydrogenase dihydrolipoyllysine-residue acetyltransferase subunit [Alphaproteobacteria bacterium]